MVCGRPFSASEKAPLVRPRINSPFLARTVASTLTTLTSVEKDGVSWPLMRRHGENRAAAPSTKRRLPQRPWGNWLRIARYRYASRWRFRKNVLRAARPQLSFFQLSSAAGAGGTYFWAPVFPSSRSSRLLVAGPYPLWARQAGRLSRLRGPLLLLLRLLPS